MENERLIKKTGTYFIGNLSTKILTACLVFLYAFYINAEDLGKYEYIQTLTNIIVPIFFLSIWEGIIKYILSENKEEDRNKIITTSAIFSVFSCILISIAVLVYYFFTKTQKTYLPYILITYVLNGLTYVWQYYVKALYKNRTYIKSSIYGSIVSLILAVVLICFMNLKLEALFISNILGILTTLLIIEKDLKVFRNINKKDIDISLLGKMIKYSYPLVLNSISLWVLNGFAKTIIQNVLGAEENGIYSFACKFTVIITFIGTILNMAITEEMLLTEKEKFNKKFSRISQEILEKFLSLATIALPFIMIAYEIIRNTQYYESKIYVPILIMYSLILAIATNLSITFKVYEKTKYQFITTLLGAIITIIVSFITINYMGILGVIVAQLLGVIITFISRYILMRKYTKLKLKWKKNLLLLILYIIIGVLCLYLNVVENVILAFIITSFTIYLYKRDVKNLILAVKEKLKKNR